MNALTRTRRLLGLYSAQQRASEARLQAAGADLLKTSNLYQDCLNGQLQSDRHRRAALALGDAGEQAIGHSMLAAGSLHAGRLQQQVKALELVREEAAAAHLTSRMEAAQMEQLVTRAAQEMQQQSVRRDQLDSDDRFASRRGPHDLRDPLRITER